MIWPIARAALVLPLLAGCVAVPHEQPRVAQTEAQSLGLEARPAIIDEKWWEVLNDPQLNQLVESGLAGNPTLDVALARLRRAQAEVSIEHAGLLPRINGTGFANRAHIGDKLAPTPIGGSTANLAIVGANLDWDIDLFGRQKALVAQARASEAAARLDAAAARLAIATSVSQTYIGLAQANEQIRVADRFVEIRRQSLVYVRSRIQNQLSSEFDQRTAETLLAEAQQAKVRAEKQRDLLIHALAALAGRGADLYRMITRPVLALDRPPSVPDVLPADLLGRRPDLLAGQARINAAVSGRKVARAEFLPDVNLQSLAGLASIGLGNIFTGGAGSYAGGAALHVPIFEGGRLRAQYRSATADLDAAVADYDGMVFDAVRETADALTAVHASDADLIQQDLVVAGLRDTVRLDHVRVATGLGSRLDAIDSGFRLLEAEQTLVDLRADSLVRRVQLIVALGGGFDPIRPLGAAPQPDKSL